MTLASSCRALARSVRLCLQEAPKLVLSQCFSLRCAISQSVTTLADHSFKMDRIDARNALDNYREAINSTDRLQEFVAKI